MAAKTSRRARAQAQPRRGALLHDLAAEAEQRRRPPPGRGRGFAGRLDQGRGFNQAAEILLVQVAPRDRLHGALQLGEGEFARHQLEYDGTVFELGAQPRDRGGEDAAVIEAHRLAQPGRGLPRQRGFAAVAACLLDQAGLVDELVAVEHLLLVPRAAAERETRPHALAPAQRTRRRGLGRAARPILEQRQDDLVEDVRPLLPPIFPREEAIPWLEAGAGRMQGGKVLRHAREREIADRDDVGAGIARPRVAAAIAEGVELLDVADRKAGLGLDPGPQPDFEGAMRQRVERPEREPRAGLSPGGVAGHQNGRLLALHRHDRGGEPDLDWRERGFGHGGSVARALDVGACETWYVTQDSTHAQMTCRRASNGSKRAFDQLESWRLLNLTLDGLGAVEEVIEIDPDLTEQRARVQPNGKPSAGGSILPRASSTQELWGAL